MASYIHILHKLFSIFTKTIFLTFKFSLGKNRFIINVAKYTTVQYSTVQSY